MKLKTFVVVLLQLAALSEKDISSVAVVTFFKTVKLALL
jgi:hypothetical protein